MTTPVTADLFQASRAPGAKPSHKEQLGQFLTPPGIARFMASRFQGGFSTTTRLLDAGAGQGALASAFADLWQTRREAGASLVIDAYEFDTAIIGELRATVARQNAQPGVTAELIAGDFVERAATMIRLGRGPRYTHAILNPPYRKISTDSDHRRFLRAAGLETVNLYSGFVGLAVELLEPSGQIVAIVPRSFCNGPYYEPFRHYLLDRAALRQVHLFDARNKAFKGDGVLQENVIVHLERGAPQGDVRVSTSTDDGFQNLEERVHPFERIVFPGDAGRFIHIPTGDDEDHLRAAAFGHSLEDLGLRVSTGPVVDFRVRDDLRADPEPGAAPLLYPGHFMGDALEWPRVGFKKANAIRVTPATRKWLYPSGFYTVVRRFSTKEERRRLVASVVDPSALPDGPIGFENHLNVFHQDRRPLSEELARGLAVFLSASVVDRYFRRFNGHTQVNATDLRAMRYPSRSDLAALGAWAKATPSLSQQAIDDTVGALA